MTLQSKKKEMFRNKDENITNNEMPCYIVFPNYLTYACVMMLTQILYMKN